MLINFNQNSKSFHEMSWNFAYIYKKALEIIFDKISVISSFNSIIYVSYYKISEIWIVMFFVCVFNSDKNHLDKITILCNRNKNRENKFKIRILKN